MGFQPFHIVMQTRHGLDVPPPAFATAVPAMFEALLDVFAPMLIDVVVDPGSEHSEVIRIERLDDTRRYGSTPLWCDEVLTRHPLTSCKPDLGADVIAELYDRLRDVRAEKCHVNAEGALLHRAANTDAPAWYGHWRFEQELYDLADVTFTWTADPLRGFDMFCPLSGYPFTSIRPLHKPKLGDGDPELAQQNRELLMPALQRVRGALGFDREEVVWSIEGHCFEQRDNRELQSHWLPRLRAS